jgi:hypothetical protein
MGFFTGRLTFMRYSLQGNVPRMFGQEHLEALLEHIPGRQRFPTADGVEVGWTACGHILDTKFELEKNIINDMLWFSFRIDTQKLPSDLLKAYTQIEITARAASNPSGFASARQKREAKEAARDQLEELAKDGRYTKRKAFEMVWDRVSNELLVGTTSMTNLDRLFVMFKDTFGFGFDSITAGKKAYQLAELQSRSRNVDDAQPSPFLPGLSPAEFAWVLDETSRDFLGNEFLLWLWFTTEADTDTIKLSDDSEVVIMLARTLTLECPRAQTGHETITHEGPTRLPEARKAIQSGKMPRKVGLTLVRHSKQYEFTLNAETLAISGLKFPPPEEEDARAQLNERADQIRHLMETMDLLYEAFGQKRFGSEWTNELLQMQKWLQREERRKVPVA